MQELLPKIHEIEPIIGDWKTFSDCSYNCDWNDMMFEKKLQTICDIVKQTMLYKELPNNEEENDMIGDSFTAAKISMQYLKENNIGTNIRMAYSRKRFYENDNAISNHIILLIDDNYNNTYYYDATPNVGYGYGKVCLFDAQKYFDEIIPLSIEDVNLISLIRKYNNKLISNNISDCEMKELENIMHSSSSYVINEYIIGIKRIINSNDKNCDLNFSIWNDLLSEWNKELHDLIESNMNYNRQIEIIQTLQSEKSKYNSSLIRYANIGNNYYPLTYLSPRFFYDNELTMVLIKPSSYLLGISSTVREKFLTKGNGAIGEYIINMGGRSEEYGMKIMHNFHPHGYKYERSMNGPNDIFLLKNHPDDVGKIKKQIRNTYGKNVNNHDLIWLDGEKIYWDPIITNLVHSTDDSTETAMHYVSPYPECQLMTRFMYPNPKLKTMKRSK